jgi:hypothetical protein
MLALLWAGFACGVLDSTAALVVYGFFGLKPIRLLQGIASGLLGTKAFSGGLATAVLGVFCHFLIAFGAAAVYLVASRALSSARKRAEISRLSRRFVRNSPRALRSSSLTLRFNGATSGPSATTSCQLARVLSGRPILLRFLHRRRVPIAVDRLRPRGIDTRHGIYSLFSANHVNTFLSAPHSAHCFAIQREGLAFRDVYQSVGSGSCGVHRVGNLLHHGTDEGPSVFAENHDRQLAALQVLSERQICVGREKHHRSSFLGRVQQVAVA